MSATAREALNQVLSHYGKTIIQKPRRLEAVLRDLAWEQPREVAVLVEALDSGAVDLLREGMPLNKAAWELCERSGVALKHAMAALETWSPHLRNEQRDTTTFRRRNRSRLKSIIAHRPGSLAEVLGSPPS
jgi:hypothetical protein